MAEILVAEDNPLNFELVRDILEADGHNVFWARDGQEAVDESRRRPFDLVLLDLHMPRLDGLQVLEAIRADGVTKRVKVVVVSADAMGGVAETVMAAGADGYLSKPLEIQTLVAEVERHLNG